MRRHLLAVAVVLLAWSAARADDWPAPTRQEVRSASKRFRAVVVPDAHSPRAPARLAVYDDRDPARPALVYQRDTVNREAPVTVLVGDGGEVVTLDEWSNTGFDHALVIYAADGALVIDRRLEELLLTEELGKVERSVSSRWWLAEPKATLGRDAVTVHTAWGVDLDVALVDGSQTRAGKPVAIPRHAERFGAYASGRRRYDDVQVELTDVHEGKTVWGQTCFLAPPVASCQAWGEVVHKPVARKIAAGDLSRVLASCQTLALSAATSRPGGHQMIAFTFTEAGSGYRYVAMIANRKLGGRCVAGLRRLAGLRRR